jgi:flagellar basal body-associated protein FliL
LDSGAKRQRWSFTLRIAAILFGFFLAVSPAFGSGGGGAPEAEAHGEKAKGPKARSVTTLKSFIPVDAFTISVIQDNEARGTLSIALGLDVPDEALFARAQALLPRLRNNWLLALNHYAATQLRPNVQADVETVAAKLQQIADDTLGMPGAKVLLSQAMAKVSR